VTSKNVHEGKKKYHYFRFPISSWYWSPFDMNTDQGVLRFFLPVFLWIEERTAAGGNVLIHCLAGAHRAGTTSVSWLMYANGMGVQEAIRFGKSCRDAINPIGSFPELLKKLEKALKNKYLVENLKKSVNVKKDIKLIHKASLKL
jgi:protein-tyrosine phosphatase